MGQLKAVSLSQCPKFVPKRGGIHEVKSGGFSLSERGSDAISRHMVGGSAGLSLAWPASTISSAGSSNCRRSLAITAGWGHVQKEKDIVMPGKGTEKRRS